MDSTLYWLWLAEALGSGYRLAGRLLEEYPDPAELYGQVKAGWNPPEYLSARAREFMQAVAPAQMAGLKKRCDDLNIFILTPDSADYPQRLRDLPDLPLVLYGTGNPACLNGRRYVGMVGTRRPTKYGLSACRDLSLTMAERGVVIVSGLAEGLDGAGHRAAVEAGRTCGYSTPRSLPGRPTAAKRPSSAPLATRSILRSWILWQISVRPRPQRRQSLLCPTVPNRGENYALWKKIFTIVSNLS